MKFITMKVMIVNATLMHIAARHLALGQSAKQKAREDLNSRVF